MVIVSYLWFACGSPLDPLPLRNERELAQSLSVRLGCEDLVFVAHDADDTAGFVLEVPDLIATSDRGWTRHTWDLPDEAVLLEYREGIFVTDGVCVPATSDGGRVDGRYDPIAGTVTIDLHVKSDSAEGWLRFDDVEFELVFGEGTASFGLPYIEIVDIVFPR